MSCETFSPLYPKVGVRIVLSSVPRLSTPFVQVPMNKSTSMYKGKALVSEVRMLLGEVGKL